MRVLKTETISPRETIELREVKEGVSDGYHVVTINTSLHSQKTQKFEKEKEATTKYYKVVEKAIEAEQASQDVETS